jgi:hypothetical protein
MDAGARAARPSGFRHSLKVTLAPPSRIARGEVPFSYAAFAEPQVSDASGLRRASAARALTAAGIAARAWTAPRRWPRDGSRAHPTAQRVRGRAENCRRAAVPSSCRLAPTTGPRPHCRSYAPRRSSGMSLPQWNVCGNSAECLPDAAVEVRVRRLSRRHIDDEVRGCVKPRARACRDEATRSARGRTRPARPQIASTASGTLDRHADRAAAAFRAWPCR